MGLISPVAYGSDWIVSPIEPEIRSWRGRLWNKNSIPFHLWSIGLIRRALREFRPDVVDIHEEPYWPSGAQVAWLARQHPVVLYTAQNILKPLPPPVAAVQRSVLRAAGACYPCSRGAAEVLRQRGFRGHIAVVPLGVDDQLFDVSPSGTRVGFVGRLVPEKGVTDLLAFGERLLAVGSGPLADQVRSVGGEVRRAGSLGELSSALREMAVLVAPSRTTGGWREQFGRMTVEAMAAGVPVVASDSGALPEVVGDAGIIVPEGNLGALHDAVNAVLMNPGDLGERGRSRAQRLYRWAVVAQQMERVYEAAIAA